MQILPEAIDSTEHDTSNHEQPAQNANQDRSTEAGRQHHTSPQPAALVPGSWDQTRIWDRKCGRQDHPTEWKYYTELPNRTTVEDGCDSCCWTGSDW